MNAQGHILLQLAGYFSLMSLFAIGGGNAAVPDMHRVAVDTMHWMTNREFADLFAIAQVTPGPNALIVTLIGYRAAGVPGALVTTFAMCGPSCMFAYYMGRIWDRFRQAPWRAAIQRGLLPVSVGLIGATAVVVTHASATSWVAVAITAATALITYRVRLNPLWLFAAAAVLGLAGAL